MKVFFPDILKDKLKETRAQLIDSAGVKYISFIPREDITWQPTGFLNASYSQNTSGTSMLTLVKW